MTSRIGALGRYRWILYILTLATIIVALGAGAVQSKETSAYTQASQMQSANTAVASAYAPTQAPADQEPLTNTAVSPLSPKQFYERLNGAGGATIEEVSRYLVYDRWKNANQVPYRQIGITNVGSAVSVVLQSVSQIVFILAAFIITVLGWILQQVLRLNLIQRGAVFIDELFAKIWKPTGVLDNSHDGGWFGNGISILFVILLIAIGVGLYRYFRPAIMSGNINASQGNPIKTVLIAAAGIVFAVGLSINAAQNEDLHQQYGFLSVSNNLEDSADLPESGGAANPDNWQAWSPARIILTLEQIVSSLATSVANVISGSSSVIYGAAGGDQGCDQYKDSMDRMYKKYAEASPIANSKNILLSYSNLSYVLYLKSWQQAYFGTSIGAQNSWCRVTEIWAGAPVGDQILIAYNTGHNPAQQPNFDNGTYLYKDAGNGDPGQDHGIITAFVENDGSWRGEFESIGSPEDAIAKTFTSGYWGAVSTFSPLGVSTADEEGPVFYRALNYWAACIWTNPSGSMQNGPLINPEWANVVSNTEDDRYLGNNDGEICGLVFDNNKETKGFDVGDESDAQNFGYSEDPGTVFNAIGIGKAGDGWRFALSTSAAGNPDSQGQAFAYYNRTQGLDPGPVFAQACITLLLVLILAKYLLPLFLGGLIAQALTVVGLVFIVLLFPLFFLPIQKLRDFGKSLGLLVVWGMAALGIISLIISILIALMAIFTIIMVPSESTGVVDSLLITIMKVVAVFLALYSFKKITSMFLKFDISNVGESVKAIGTATAAPLLRQAGYNVDAQDYFNMDRFNRYRYDPQSSRFRDSKNTNESKDEAKDGLKGYAGAAGQKAKDAAKQKAGQAAGVAATVAAAKATGGVKPVATALAGTLGAGKAKGKAKSTYGAYKQSGDSTLDPSFNPAIGGRGDAINSVTGVTGASALGAAAAGTVIGAAAAGGSGSYADASERHCAVVSCSNPVPVGSRFCSEHKLKPGEYHDYGISDGKVYTNEALIAGSASGFNNALNYAPQEVRDQLRNTALAQGTVDSVNALGLNSELERIANGGGGIMPSSISSINPDQAISAFHAMNPDAIEIQGLEGMDLATQVGTAASRWGRGEEPSFVAIEDLNEVQKAALARGETAPDIPSGFVVVGSRDISSLGAGAEIDPGTGIAYMPTAMSGVMEAPHLGQTMAMGVVSDGSTISLPDPSESPLAAALPYAVVAGAGALAGAGLQEHSDNMAALENQASSVSDAAVLARSSEQADRTAAALGAASVAMTNPTDIHHGEIDVAALALTNALSGISTGGKDDLDRSLVDQLDNIAHTASAVSTSGDQSDVIALQSGVDSVRNALMGQTATPEFSVLKEAGVLASLDQLSHALGSGGNAGVHEYDESAQALERMSRDIANQMPSTAGTGASLDMASLESAMIQAHHATQVSPESQRHPELESAFDSLSTSLQSIGSPEIQDSISPALVERLSQLSNQIGEAGAVSAQGSLDEMPGLVAALDQVNASIDMQRDSGVDLSPLESAGIIAGITALGSALESGPGRTSVSAPSSAEVEDAFAQATRGINESDHSSISADRIDTEQLIPVAGMHRQDPSQQDAHTANIVDSLEQASRSMDDASDTRASTGEIDVAAMALISSIRNFSDGNRGDGDSESRGIENQLEALALEAERVAVDSRNGSLESASEFGDSLERIRGALNSVDDSTLQNSLQTSGIVAGIDQLSVAVGQVATNDGQAQATISDLVSSLDQMGYILGDMNSPETMETLRTATVMLERAGEQLMDIPQLDGMESAAEKAYIAAEALNGAQSESRAKAADAQQFLAQTLEELSGRGDVEVDALTRLSDAISEMGAAAVIDQGMFDEAIQSLEQIPTRSVDQEASVEQLNQAIQSLASHPEWGSGLLPLDEVADSIRRVQQAMEESQSMDDVMSLINSAQDTAENILGGTSNTGARQAMELLDDVAREARSFQATDDLAVRAAQETQRLLWDTREQAERDLSAWEYIARQAKQSKETVSDIMNRMPSIDS